MTYFHRMLRLMGGLFFVTNVACGPATVYVQPAPQLTFDQIIHDEVTLGARRPAHAMAALVRGDKPTDEPNVIEPKRWPEAYTLDGSEGTRVSEYHLGYAAQRLIRIHYADAYPAKNVPESYEVTAIVDAAGGSDADIRAEHRTWPVDVVDVDRRFVFEMVPPGETHQAEGKTKANLHAMLLNTGLWQKPQFKLGMGYSGELGVRFAENAAPWKLSWQTPEPGVIAFRWQALTVAKVTEESCRNAYLAKQWHDVTPKEMAQFAGPLHRVVEELVQAREKLGPTRAAIKMPVVPGRTLFDYLDTVAKWSAHDERRAQLLPVMYGPPVTVVPRKQFVAETLEDEELYGEGVYDLKGVPGRQPWNLHMGNSAHRLIGNYYALWRPKRTVFTNWTSIATIVKEITNTEPLLKRSEALLRPDIADTKEKVVFEIKSRAPGRLAEGQTAVNKYLALLNQFMGPDEKFKPGTGFNHSFLVRFDHEMPWFNLAWATVSPGVIQYRWQELNSDEVDANKIAAGVEAGKYVWVDMTQSNMEKYAAAINNGSREYVGLAQTLYKTQSVTGLVVEVIGHVTIAHMSPGLSPKTTASPQGATQSLQSRPNVQAKPSIPSKPNVPTNKLRVSTQPPTKGQSSPGSSHEPDIEPEVSPDVARWQQR